jgi:hypothetical protein
MGYSKGVELEELEELIGEIILHQFNVLRA